MYVIDARTESPSVFFSFFFGSLTILSSLLPFRSSSNIISMFLFKIPITHCLTRSHTSACALTPANPCKHTLAHACTHMHAHARAYTHALTRAHTHAHTYTHRQPCRTYQVPISSSVYSTRGIGWPLENNINDENKGRAWETERDLERGSSLTRVPTKQLNNPQR